nr:heparinase II/III family protein [Brachybacterium halotolerans]
MGLAACGAALDDTHYVELAANRASALLSQEYDSEGINAEGAVGYHLNNYRWWNEARTLFIATGHDVQGDFDVLAGAPTALAHATQPDGTLVPIGNTGTVRPTSVRHPHLDYVNSAGARGEAPDSNVAVYTAGYAYGRSGWGEHERSFDQETFFSLSFGSNSRVHGHKDGGSLTLFADGGPWIVDPGKYSYDFSADRTHFVERESHNVVIFAGEDRHRKTSVDLIQHKASAAVEDFKFRDEGYPDSTIERRVVYSNSGEYLVVVDTIDSRREVDARQQWQTAPGVTVEMDKNSFHLERDGAHALVSTFGIPPELEIHEGEEDPLVGWVATGWREREPAPLLSARRQGTRFRFVTAIVPGFRSNKPTVTNVQGLPKGFIGLDVDTGRATERILISANSVSVCPPTISPEALLRLVENDAASDDTETEYDMGREELVRASRDTRANAWRKPSIESRSLLAERLIEEAARAHPSERAIARSTVTDLLGTTDTSSVVGTRSRAGLLAWPGIDLNSTSGDRVRSLLGTDEIVDVPREQELHTYDLGDLVLPLLVAPDPGDTLTVLFHGAIDRARIELPYFQRIRYQRTLGAGPTIAVSDPTLDLSESLRLGWYLGTTELDLIRKIADVISTYREALGVRNVVLQGGSGGGFAAIAASIYVPGSIAVAFDPQTDLPAYSARFYQAAIDAAFGSAAARDQSLVPRERVDLIARMTAHGHPAKVHLVSNIGDEIHRERHARRLREFLLEQNGECFAETALDLGPGHSSPSNEQYRIVMESVYSELE